jgi:hypothetical protein
VIMEKILIITLRVVVINILLFLLLFFSFYMLGFLLGWADSGNHEKETWLLYSIFMGCHFIINLLFINPLQKGKLNTIISAMLIMALNAVVIYVYR